MQLVGARTRVFWGVLADRIRRGQPVLVGLGLASAVSAAATALLGPGTPSALVLMLLGAFAASAIGWNGVFLSEVARLSGPEGWAGPRAP